MILAQHPSPWSAPDWSALFTPDVPIAEIVFRGSVLYLSLLILMRVLKRQVGELNMGDLLVLVILADAAQNAMSGTYNSITDGILLVGTILAWSYLLDAVAYRSKFVRNLLEPRPRMLIVNGELQHRNLRRALITTDELASQLRHHGVHDVREVREARIEGDGRVSVVKQEEEGGESEETEPTRI